jgi:hypothetical protein
MSTIASTVYRCAVAMNERPRAAAGTDGVCWYCPQCKTTKSIRAGSFFSKSKLPLQKWLIAIVWWTREYPVCQMAFEAQIAENTAIDIYQWRAYTQVATVPGVAGHATVNHSVNFVDPQTGIHTQHIESYWNQVKVKLLTNV